MRSCRDVAEGDVLLGLAVDGVHSNGYSLVRKLVEVSGLDWADDCPFDTGTLGAALLVPTRLYVKPALSAIGMGGGDCSGSYHWRWLDRKYSTGPARRYGYKD